MKIRCAVLLFVFALTVSGQRFISGPEQEQRLLVPKEQRVISSPLCSEATKITLKATIDPTGAVRRIKEVKGRSLQRGQDKLTLGRLVEQAKRVVLYTWRYRPLLVGGKPTSITTFVTIPCMPQ